MKTTQNTPQNKRNKILFNLLAGVLFPLYTFYLVLLANPLYTNLSFIGNGLGYRYAVLLWGVIGAFVFRHLLNQIAQLLHVNWSKKMDGVFIIMVGSLALPYLPQVWPFLAQLHILASYLAFGLLNYLILYILYQGRYFAMKRCTQALNGVSAILAVCGGLFLIFGSINSLLEIFYTCFMTWLLMILTTKINK